MDLSSPLFQGNRLLSYLGGVVRVWGKPEIGLSVRSTHTGLKVLSSKIYESLEALQVPEFAFCHSPDGCLAMLRLRPAGGLQLFRNSKRPLSAQVSRGDSPEN